MPQESRVKKSLLNARVNLIFYFLTLVLSFFSRKIFLDCLGADFIGLTGTLYNLLGFLNLAELGIGSAIGYVLYKPIFDHDKNKINEIISVMGYLYRWIGFIILGAGCILACFLPLIFPNTGFDLSLIYFAYFSFLTSSLIGYFINYRQNLLGADQRNYVVTAYYQSATIIKTIIQMVAAYYTKNYFLWVAFELVFGIIYSFILNWKINQTYPWLKSEIKEGKRLLKKYPEVIKNTKQLFIHQINGFIQFQTTPILTYTFVSLKIVAFYENYTLILDKACLLMNNFLGSTSAGVGNLIAEGNQIKINRVFWQITGIRIWFAGIITFVTYLSLEPLVTLWLGEEYILEHNILVLLLLRIYTQISLGGLTQFTYGHGLFSDVWASLLQTTIFLFVAIVGGFLYGLAGILFASFVSIFIIMGIWKPYFLYSRSFKKSVWLYWKDWLGYNLINICAFTLTFFIYTSINISFHKLSVITWSINTLVIATLFILVSSILFFTLTQFAKNTVKSIFLR